MGLQQMEPAKEGKNHSQQSKLKVIFQIQWLRPVVLISLTSATLFIVLKVFFFEFFKVNQADMEDSYFQNEVLLLQKLPLEPERGEVYQIRYPHKDETQQEIRFIQRLIALPGDCVSVSGKEIRVNGVSMARLETEKHNYFIKTKNYEPSQEFRLNYGLRQGGRVSTGFDYSYPITKNNKEQMEKDSLIAEIREKTEKPGRFDADCFPGSPHFPWNSDHYGPLYLPKAGDTLALDSTNLPLFETLIRDYENNTLLRNEDSIYINGIYSVNYVVKQNYYFFMSDNRDNAVDSRHFGYLPESCIRARVVQRIFSKKP